MGEEKMRLLLQGIFFCLLFLYGDGTHQHTSSMPFLQQGFPPIPYLQTFSLTLEAVQSIPFFHFTAPQPPPIPPPIPPPLPPLPNYHATFNFKAAHLLRMGFPNQKKAYTKDDWRKFRTIKGWKEGVLDPPPLSKFSDAGVKLGVFSDQPTALEVFNYFMTPIKNEMVTTILEEYKKNPDAYASYRTCSELKEEDLQKEIDRYLAANIEIRRMQRRSLDMNKWWGPLEEDGNKFIQQCLSKNRFKFIKYSFMASKTIDDIEQLMDIVKEKTHKAVNLPLYVVVDECMVKARIKHLLNRIFMPDKPVRNGFKFWVLGASFNGIPIIWEFNQCKTDTEGSTTMVETVMELVKTLENKGHIVICDRGFGSIALADELSNADQNFVLSCKSDRPTEVFSKGLDQDVEEGELRTYVGTLSDNKPVLAGVYFPENSEDSKKSCSLVHCLTNVFSGETWEVDEDDGEMIPEFCRKYRLHYHDGPDQYDAKEALVKDPHKHKNAQSVLFSWCLSVVLCNSYAIYCVKNGITTPEKKRDFPLNKFLLNLREELLPPCKLVETYGTSKKTGKPISLKRKCSFCISKLGKECCLFPSPQTDLYCARCDQFLHPLCHKLVNNPLDTS